MADYPFLFYTPDNRLNTSRTIHRGFSPFIGANSAVLPILSSAKKVGSQVRVDFSQSLRNLPATTIAANYSFTGPSSITTASVVFTPGNSFVLLNVTGTFKTGNYACLIAALTVQSNNLDTFNNNLSSNFDVVAPRPPPRFYSGFG